MSSTQQNLSFDSLEKAAEFLAKRAVVGRLTRQMRKEAITLDSLKELATAAGSDALNSIKNNPLPYGMAAGGALLGGGSALVDKKKRRNLLRNTVYGGLTGGITGLAGQLALRGKNKQPLTGAVPPKPSAAVPSAKQVSKDPITDLKEIFRLAEESRTDDGPLDTANKMAPVLGLLGYGGTEAYYQRKNLDQFLNRPFSMHENHQNLLKGLNARASIKDSPEAARYDRLHTLLTQEPRRVHNQLAALQKRPKGPKGIAGLWRRLFGEAGGGVDSRLPELETYFDRPAGATTGGHKITTRELQQMIREGAATAAEARPGAVGTISRHAGRLGKYKGPAGRMALFGLPVLALNQLEKARDNQRAADLIRGM